MVKEDQVEAIEDFICQYCGDECDGNLKFKVSIVYTNDQSLDSVSPCCPDCVALFFTHTPEDIQTMKVEAI